MLWLLLACFICSCWGAVVSVNWGTAVYTSKTHTTFQVVVNPELRRGGPMHDGAFDAIRLLKADYVRFVPWLPYPQLGVAELYPPTGNPLCGSVVNEQSLYLACASGAIAEISVAYYGTVEGTCGNYAIVGNCSAENVIPIVEKYCLGQASCLVPADTPTFGDPCFDVVKRLAVQAICDYAVNSTSWDFSLIDPMMEDFMNATANHSVIINFSTIPQWMWNTPAPIAFPSDPNAVFWSYEQGTDLRDPTGQEVGDYYERLVSWYTKGGFTDEYGEYHTSGHKYNIPMWEVLNEVNFEHNQSPEFYTNLYDAIVTGIRKVQPDMIFVGMALANGGDPTWLKYFLNASNHLPGIPLDYISYHFYASCSNRTDPAGYSTFFDQADGQFSLVKELEAIRISLSPNTKVDLDELGVILPSDNDADAAPIPPEYWNAAGGMYAYIFANLLPQGIDVLGESQLIGFPTQFPSVTMIDWITNKPNARFWVLYVLHTNFAAGDVYVQSSSNDPNVFAAAYTTVQGKKILIINKTVNPATVDISQTGFTTGTIQVVDVVSGDNQPQVVSLNSTTINLGGYAVALVTLA